MRWWTLTEFDFEGVVALSNCSGAIVRYEVSEPTDRAMVLANGHCVGQFPEPEGRSYGQQINWIYSCLNQNRELDLAMPDRPLPQ